MGHGTALHGMRSLCIVLLRPRHTYQTPDARTFGVRRVFEPDVGTLCGVQGTPVGGKYIEGLGCMAWAILRSASTAIAWFIRLPRWAAFDRSGQSCLRFMSAAPSKRT